MDFSLLYQIRAKKYWWVDVLFYLAIALLLASALSYGIFWLRSVSLRTQIQKQTALLDTVGTEQQKAQEAEVLKYQKKLNDFGVLFKNHQFASNVFAFAQSQALPYVWFRQFILDQRTNLIQLYGSTENADALARQVDTFETNPYVQRVSLLNSKLSPDGKIDFNLNLVLDQNIFKFASDLALLPSTEIPKPVTPTTIKTIAP